MGRARWGVAAAFAALLLCGRVVAESSTVSIEGTVLQMAVSPGSGAVATIEDGKAGLVLYPRFSSEGSTDGERLARVEGKPLAICHKPGKKGVFVVVNDQRTFYVIDDTTGKQLGTVKVDVDVLDIAAPASAASSTVFYTVAHNNRDPRGGPSVGRIDVAGLKDEGLFETPGQMNDRYYIEVAADANTIYLARPDTSPTGIYALRRDPSEANRLLKAYDQHDSTFGYVPLAAALGCAIKNEIRTADLSRTLYQLPGRPLVAMHSQPVVFCQTQDERQVIAVSVNTGKSISTQSLAPAQKLGEKNGKTAYQRAVARRAQMPRRMKPTAFVDEANQNLLVAGGGRVSIIPLADFRLPREPLLAVRLDGSSEVVAQEAWKAALTPMEKDTKLTLAAGPQGMKLEGNKISWTPDAGSIGSTKVTLQLESRGVKTEQQIELTVRQRSIKLPFAAGSIAATPDGKIAVVLKSISPHSFHDQAQTSRLAAINLSTGAVLFEQQLDFKAMAVDASNDAVYLAAQQTDAVYSLSFANPQNVNKTFTDGMVHALGVAGGHLFVQIARRQGGNTTQVFTLPKMEATEISAPAARTGQIFFSDYASIPRDVGGGWRFNEAVWSSDFARALVLLDAPGIPGLNLLNNLGGDRSARMARWGTLVENGQIRRLSGQVIAQTGDTLGGITLVDLPAAALLRANATYDGEQRMNLIHAELAIVDLIKGKEEKILLMREQYDPQKLNPDELRGVFGRKSALISIPGKILAAVGEKLFVISTDRLARDRYAEPLFFEPQQKPILIGGGNASKVTFKIRGGAKPIKFSLVQDVQGLEVNGEAGELTVDPAKLFAADKLDQPVDLYMQMDAQAVETGGSIRDIAAKQIQAVEKWTGTKPAGVPLMVKVALRARDAAQQEAILEHVVLVDMPAEMLQKRMQDRFAAIKKTRDARQPVAVAGGGAGGDDMASLKKRVAELELENARLKAQVEVLKEIRQGGPTGSTK